MKCEQPGLVQDRPTRCIRMADQQTQREDPAAARTEGRRWCSPESSQQPRRIIGLLLRRGCRPATRHWAAPIAPSVIAHDHELVRQKIGKRFEMTRVSRCPHD